ncbi:TspO/MBR family protein [Teladorsagia circumcincta]|uniref:TspO/MBR family protein n=2 Tax=Teladorsagia circumcincta TaxID=45464 RepID=A0A2G9TV30_TELCI|nr:TspO/MBR family protein [Teladorsagia circumcincta]
MDAHHTYETDQPTFAEGKISDRFLTTRGALENYVENDRMPFWTTQDTRNAMVATMIPGGAAIAAFALFARDKETVDWWSTQVKKPDWAPSDVRLYSIMDILALSPLGYASYLVYKSGGGFDYTDTRLALGLYGANMMFALTTIPLVKKKNLGCLWKNTLMVHLTAAGAAYAFYKIDKQAGMWMIPYAVWTGFYAFLTYSIDKENQVMKDF